MADPIVALVVSRRKTIATLEKEVADFKAQIARSGAASPAGVALAGVVKVKEQRLAKVKEELRGFEQLLEAGDPRQLEVPGSTRPKR